MVMNEEEKQKKGFHHMAIEFTCPHWMAIEMDLVATVGW